MSASPKVRSSRTNLSISFANLALLAIVLVVLTNGLDAFTFAGVPVPWLSQVGAICAALALISLTKVRLFPGSLPLALFVLWLGSATLLGTIFGNFSREMPPATTSYPVFVSLRFINVFAIASLALLVYFVCREGKFDHVRTAIVWVGSLMALIALYNYGGSIFGLPFLIGNRLGTGAEGEIATVFYGGVNRSLGTFREPGDLARWLITPLFLSLSYRKPLNVHSITIGLAFLATLSLTGFLSFGFAFLLAPVLTGSLRLSTVRRVLAAGIIGVVSLAGLYSFFSVLGLSATHASTLGGINQSTNFLLFTFNRLRDIVELGVLASNRSHVINHVLSAPPPLIGSGLGNANIAFSGPKIDSFLSLYINIYFSGGLAGLALLFAFMCAPLVFVLLNRRCADSVTFYMVAAYLAWCIVYLVAAEELAPMFAVLVGMIPAYMHHRAVTYAPPDH